MTHLIEFTSDVTADLEVGPKQRLEQMRIQKGTQAQARVRPYVVETPQGPVEMADLYFADGTVARGVRFEQFRFVV